MNKTDEALKLALEALEISKCTSKYEQGCHVCEAITAIKQALAAPVQSGLDADCIASVVSQRYTTPPAQHKQEILAEREACAKVAAITVCDTHIPTGVKIYGTAAAKAIRARSNT